MSFLEHRIVRDARALAQEHREKLPYIVGSILCLLIYAFSQSKESSVHVYKTEGTPDFKDARVLGSQSDSIYEGKEKLLSKTVRELMAAQAQLKESNDRLVTKVSELEAGKIVSPNPSPSPSSVSDSAKVKDAHLNKESIPENESIRTSAEPENLAITQGVSEVSTRVYSGSRYLRRERVHGSGPSIISFPVKDIAVEKTEGIALPAGSYVKAKLMTGVEAPEGKTFPALLQLDYAYIVPNKHKLDLSGCFMIAKTQGDLSTERVQMQASKLSCVSKDGKMFEREVNGFIADDKDNSFAVIGSVNSKQDRVAAMAFLSSIVEGVGKALQQAQTTQTATPLGGAQSVITGNQAQYMAAGGAANAASMVTQWYLKQAQNLLPTINVGSGQDVWIIMQDSVKLPNDYFRKNTKGGTSESVYTYFSRVLD